MSLFEVITKEEFESSGTSGLGIAEDDLLAVGSSGMAGEPAHGVPETYPCNYCGHCETPDDCAWAHTCPKCGAPAGKIGFQTYCKTPTGGITGLHAERWAT